MLQSPGARAMIMKPLWAAGDGLNVLCRLDAVQLAADARVRSCTGGKGLGGPCTPRVGPLLLRRLKRADCILETARREVRTGAAQRQPAVVAKEHSELPWRYGSEGVPVALHANGVCGGGTRRESSRLKLSRCEGFGSVAGVKLCARRESQQARDGFRRTACSVRIRDGPW